MDYVEIDDSLQQTGEEAHYWWTVSAFADLSLNHDLYKMMSDMIELRGKLLQKGEHDEQHGEG